MDAQDCAASELDATVATTHRRTGALGVGHDSALEVTSTTFDRTTGVTATGPGEFEVQLSPVWGSLVGMLGGSLVAVAVRGLEATVPDRHVRTVSTSFSRAGQPGPAHLAVEVLHASRSVTIAVATLTQEGRLLTTTRGTLVGERAGPDWSAPQRLVNVDIEDCVPIEPPWPMPHFDQAEGVLDPHHVPFTGEPVAEIRGYVRPIERRPIDAAWLSMISDWFPPPAFVRLEPPGGGISIDLVVHIHRTVTDLGGSWLTGAFGIETAVGGLGVEHGRIATPDGRLLAESFHTRWTADAAPVTTSLITRSNRRDIR